jgi:hypothetical protein
MKTLFISLAALAAVSGAALASDRNDPRDLDSNFSKFSIRHGMESSVTDSNAFAVVKAGKSKLTAFQRMNLDAGKDHGRQTRESHVPVK